MFELPRALWLLLLLPLVVAPSVASMRGKVRTRAIAEALLRAGCFVILVLALAGLRIATRASASRLAVVALVDQSRSIAQDQLKWMEGKVAELGRAMEPDDQLAVVGFGRDVRLLAAPNNPHSVRALRGEAQGEATDIGAALVASVGLFPEGYEKRILLLSDGNETMGNATAEVPVLAEEQVHVYSATPPPSATMRVALTEFSAPETVRANASFAFHLEVESEGRTPASVRLKLLRDGTMVGLEQVTLKPGLNRFDLPYRIGQPGAFSMTAEVEAAPPLVLLNPRLETTLSVPEPQRLLLVSSTLPQGLLDALRLRKYPVTQAAPEGLPENAEDYLEYGAVILAKASADSLSPKVQQALNRYVADYGGGLVAVGELLGDERFRGSVLEKTLPVNFQVQPPPPEREPIAIYLCIDRSNSMSYNSRDPEIHDFERIDYAKRAALALLGQLDATDMAGVVAFDSAPYVLAHLGRLADNRAELEDRIARLQPGGGTDFKESVEIAEKEIMESGVATRQIVLLTDGDTNRDYEEHNALIADLAAKHIPVSTIRIGPELTNLRLLEEFAQATGGVFYRVSDIERLPQLLVHLTRKTKDHKASVPNKIEVSGQSAILSGIPGPEIPAVDFAAATVPKDEAEIPLMLKQADSTVPLLVAWQYGLGRSAAFMADPDSPAMLPWTKWERYAEFWSQLLTWVMREASGNFDLKIEPTAEGGVQLEAQKITPGAAPSDLFCRVAGSDRFVDVTLSLVGSSSYRAATPALARGKYTATLMAKAGDTGRPLLTREFALKGKAGADAAELRLRPANVELLRRLAAQTGGTYNAPIAKLASHRGATITAYRSTRGYLLPLAILLFLGEVFVRRRFPST